MAPEPVGQARRVRLAELLIEARLSGRQIADLPAELLPDSPAEAYAVAELVTAGTGWEPGGWKIAGTTAEMQRRLRVHEPIYGRSFARFIVASPAVFDLAELLDPIVECEFFCRLGADLPPRPEPFGRAELIRCIAAVHAGVEVAECRFPLASLPPAPAVLADGSASGRYVLGPEIPHWQDGLASVPVRLEVAGAVRRRGSGAEVMGDPLEALLWLANARRVWGDGLREGDLVSTGTATGMKLAKPADRMTAIFADTLRVELAFSA